MPGSPAPPLAVAVAVAVAAAAAMPVALHRGLADAWQKRELPKSHTFTVHLSSTSRFDDLRSWWRIGLR